MQTEVLPRKAEEFGSHGQYPIWNVEGNDYNDLSLLLNFYLLPCLTLVKFKLKQVGQRVRAGDIVYSQPLQWYNKGSRDILVWERNNQPRDISKFRTISNLKFIMEYTFIYILM